MYTLKRSILIFFTLATILMFLVSCKGITTITEGGNIPNPINNPNPLVTPANNSIPQSGNKRSAADIETIRRSVDKFALAIKNEDSDYLKEILNQSGIFIIRNFLWGAEERGKDVVLHFNADEINKELIVDIPDEIPVFLPASFSGLRDIGTEDLPVNESTVLNEISYKIDWDKTDSENIKSSIKQVIEASEQIIKENNKMDPQIFVLADDTFVLTESSYNDGLQGSWAVFQKSNDKYELRAIMIWN